MAQQASAYPYLSVDDYLKVEEAAPVRHEYVDGQLYAFAGTTDRHERIVRNIVRQLLSATNDTSCELFFSNLKVKIGETFVYYPDLMVVCDPNDNNPLYREHPCLLIEVLSPSTQSTDLREKLFAYRQLPSLETYLIVWQDQRRVQFHFRNTDDRWANAEVVQTGDIPLKCPDMTLTLDDVYRNIDI